MHSMQTIIHPLHATFTCGLKHTFRIPPMTFDLYSTYLEGTWHRYPARCSSLEYLGHDSNLSLAMHERVRARATWWWWMRWHATLYLIELIVIFTFCDMIYKCKFLKPIQSVQESQHSFCWQHHNCIGGERKTTTAGTNNQWLFIATEPLLQQSSAATNNTIVKEKQEFQLCICSCLRTITMSSAHQGSQHLSQGMILMQSKSEEHCLQCQVVEYSVHFVGQSISV